MDLLEIIDAIWSLKDRLSRYISERGSNADAALRSMSIALDETHIYYERHSERKSRDRKAEEMLAKYWSAAAIAIRGIDPNLARVLDEKSQYWIRPHAWSDSDIAAAGIRLSTLRKRYRALLVPRKVVLKGRRLSQIAPARRPQKKNA